MDDAKREALLLVLYCFAYVAYLGWHPEGEFLHWITLVVIPVILLLLVQRAQGHELNWRDLVRSVGLGQRPSVRGISAALIVGVLVSVLQLAGRNGEAIRELIRSGRALWLWPLSVVMMIATAAGTEELFFRGMLQKRLGAALHSRALAIGGAAVLFALYHVPYAYGTPGWGVQHDLRGAVRAAAETGLPLGVLLGGVFAAAGEDTTASILAHALVNSLPGMVVIEKLLLRA